MPSQNIRLATTDGIPGNNRPIAHSSMVWSGIRDSISATSVDIQKWAAENNFHAVVGIRILQIGDIHGGVRYFPTSTRVVYIMYGTAIRYRDQ
jgi:hypothetical protein